MKPLDVTSAADDVCVGGYGFRTEDSTRVCVCVCGGALLAVRLNQTHTHAGLRGGCCRFEVHGRTSDHAREAVGRPYVVVALWPECVSVYLYA